MRISVVLCLTFLAGCGASRQPETHPSGTETTTKTEVLKAGAKVMQRDTPTDALDIYLVGFHPMKDNPAHQMEAHHFCRQVNEDFAQCALFDGNTKSANLNGVEYIISEKVFQTLPSDERQYWHPHNGEILSGQLVAPGLPQVAEKELMKSKMNSYGKTWHLWATDERQQIPLGKPMLAWSFNRDGEIRPGLLEQRDRNMKIDSAKLRQERQELQSMAHPQSGVDALKGRFPGETKDIPGVVNAR